MRSVRLGLTALLFVFLFCTLSYAEVVEKPIQVNGDQVEYLSKEKKVIGTGNVSIDYEDIALTCDKITVFMETKDAIAEGNVVLKSSMSEVKGEEVHYNFETRKGEVLKARLKLGEWYGGGEKIEILSEGTYRVKEGYITTCELEPPHYKISSSEVIIYPEEEKMVAGDVVFKVGRVPVGYMPRYSKSFKSKWPSVDVIPGKRKKWGLYALTSFRYEPKEDHALTFKLDERENWGIGEGIDYKYTFQRFGEGIVRTYYTHQRDRDRQESSRAEEERYRVQARHKWNINERLDTFLEYHKLSDSEMTKDYFYREEYEKISSPETYIYMLDRESEFDVSFLARKRVNRFQTVTEKLPESRFNLKDQDLGVLGVYFKTDTLISNLNRKVGDDAGEDRDAFRFDTYNRLSRPLRLANFLSLSPFAGTRNTFYSKDINGDSDEMRTAFYTGLDVSTKLSRTYNVSGDFLGVDFDKLHHVMTPTLEYEYIHEPSTPQTKLQQFDDIDSIDRKSTFTLGFENTLKTKRLIGDKLRVVDLGTFLVTGDFLYKPEQGSRFSDVKGDLELTPFDWLRIESDSSYNPSTRDFETWNLDLDLEKEEDLRLGFGSRYWQNQEHELTSELFYKLSHFWSARAFVRYDLKELEASGNKIVNRFNNREISVIKDLHCWLAELNVGVDRDGGWNVYFVMKLKASPSAAFNFKDHYPYPK